MKIREDVTYLEISPSFYDLIVSLEGVGLHLYRDVAGFPTIGIGHLLTRSEYLSGKIVIDKGRVIYWRKGITSEQSQAIVKYDIRKFVEVIKDWVHVPLTQYEFEALVSFCFNIGRNAFINSTLLKKLNRCRYEEVPNEMRRWKYAGGEIVQGLVNRREKEIKHWRY